MTAAELNEELERFDEEYPLCFQSPKEIVEIIGRLEETNLQQIQYNQDCEIEILEMHRHLRTLETTNCSKVAALAQTKRQLQEQIRTNEEEIKRMEARNLAFDRQSLSQNIERIKASLFTIYQQFRGAFDRGASFESVRDFDDRKNLMHCLAQIESVVYRYSVALRQSDPAVILKHVG